MLRKEAAKVGHLAKDPDTFLDKVTEFYEHHRGQLARALGTVLGEGEDVILGIVPGGRAPAIADAHCRASFAEVLEASGAPPARFEAVITETLSTWPDRAAATAKEVLP